MCHIQLNHLIRNVFRFKIHLMVTMKNTVSWAIIFFCLGFPIYLQSVYIHSNTIRKLCAEKRGWVEECSVAPLCDKRVKTLCGCRGKKGYKLRLTTKAYRLSYNYINYTINLVGRLFGRWRHRRLCSGCSLDYNGYNLAHVCLQGLRINWA
jgi:hypothetical protein